jgi:SAM-dependent methyltransferase
MTRDYDLWADDSFTVGNQQTNKKAIANQRETIKIIDSIGGLSGSVLDIGSRNHFTAVLEGKYSVTIDSTSGDLDLGLKCPGTAYDFVHYNNVIEHQFNPLLTLLQIRRVLKNSGYLILGTPLKPTIITFATCHFHEFDEYRYRKLIARAGFQEVKRVHFYRQVSVNGLRAAMGSFFNRQVLSLLRMEDGDPASVQPTG